MEYMFCVTITKFCSMQTLRTSTRIAAKRLESGVKENNFERVTSGQELGAGAFHSYGAGLKERAVD